MVNIQLPNFIKLDELSNQMLKDNKTEICLLIDAIPVEEIIKYIDANAIKYIKISSLDFQDEYKVKAEVERLFTDLINDWRKENE